MTGNRSRAGRGTSLTAAAMTALLERSAFVRLLQRSLARLSVYLEKTATDIYKGSAALNALERALVNSRFMR